MGAEGTALAPEPRTKLRVLLVEHDPADIALVRHALHSDGFDLDSEVAQSPDEFLRHLDGDGYDLVLADYNLPQWRGMEALGLLRQKGLDTPLILVTGSLGDVNAVECIKQGATDYVLKDNLTRLPVSVRRALEEARLRRERQHAQEELANKVEELARSNRELEQFAYVASHDLQEPLRMVAAYSQLLAERYREKLDENAHKYIGYAVDGALRMQTLIQDLLAFSRVGRHGLDLKLCDGNELVAEALANLRSAVDASGAQVSYASLPCLVADRSQLLQVFQNLISNAIKFHGSEPPVLVISADKYGNEWRFSVEDNGIGIAPEHTESIFVIFQRLHTRAEYPGNGMGLAICKKKSWSLMAGRSGWSRKLGTVQPFISLCR